MDRDRPAPHKPAVATLKESWSILAVVASVVAGSLVAAAPPARAAQPPSIVVIYTDDQRFDTLWAMPIVQRDLAGHGVTFSNAFVVNPLCCPSRATVLTGNYSHSTGIWRNQPPYGGFSSFDDTSTLATWLQGGGYRTGLFGKYLNGYWDAAPYVPPGWDRWVSFLRSGFFDYELNVDGTVTSFGATEAEYSTDVLAAEVESFIETSPGPLFAYFAPFAPHKPATPAPRHADAFSELERWRPPSYNERDVSDKPAWVRGLRRWNRERRLEIDAVRLDQLRSLLAVDDAVGRIVAALERTGRLSNTLILLMGDNGFTWGEHRWKGKIAPFEESIRVPFVLRYDPLVLGPRTEDQLVLNIDVAPTAAEVAGVVTPGVDGTSLVPLLVDPTAPWRSDFAIERLEKPVDRVPSFCGIRNHRHAYVVYATGEEELYNLVRDPGQLENLVPSGRAVRKLAALRTRVAELCSPPPPGMVLPSAR